ncbi:hypothetical protein WJX73_005543 [Symbiochloris irregularis]|uniref:Magnesium transporter n=1 Tax=Symbiochloris irregularis TaxID=706552 RepID=A0AAW1PZ96_9CHLO
MSHNIDNVDAPYERLSSFAPSRADSPERRYSSDEQPPWDWHGEDHKDLDDRHAGPLTDVDVVAPSHLPPSPTSSVRSQPFGSHKLYHQHQYSKSASRTGTANRESRARRSTWLCINSAGIRTVLHSDKRGIIQKFKLGVPIRDMRLMDPNLLTSATAKILVRDNAIVVSVEHVRVIVTSDMVIMPQDGFEHNKLNQAFNSLLQEHIIEHAQEEQLRAAAAQRRHDAVMEAAMEGAAVEGDDAKSSDSSGFRHEVAPLPFELQVLETCIGDVCKHCDKLSKELESYANPALDALTRSVTTKVLEHVRKVKGRHQRLIMRVRALREELQRFLEDDEDMIKLCLSRKRDLERALASSGMQHAQHGGTTPFAPSSSIPIRRSSMQLTRDYSGSSPWVGGQSPPKHHMERTESGNFPGNFAEDESESVEAVENLLESYFMQIDTVYDRLTNIGEYVQDTEEFVNIELDSARNRLIRLEIVLTAGTFALAIFSLVGGVLGENLILPSSITQTVRDFFLVNLGTLGFCLLVFIAIMAYIRFRRLM